MKILLIGNGFDLAHDLPTRYSNFLDFVNEYIWHSKSGDGVQHEEYLILCQEKVQNKVSDVIEDIIE